MKKKDLVLLVAILIFSLIISLVLSRVIFGTSSARQASVEVVDPITADFPIDQVSGSKDKQFNSNAVNPSQLIHTGDPNEHPFSNKDDQ